MRSDTPRLGPSDVALLSAIDEGLVTRGGAGPSFLYLFDGEPVGTNHVHRLRRLELIDVSLAYPPTVNPHGARVLAEYRERG